MIVRAFGSKDSPYRAWIAAVSAVAFAILVSIAATHFHTGLDSDEACAVCAAVIGKLEGPSSLPVVVPPAGIPYFCQRPPAAPNPGIAFLQPPFTPDSLARQVGEHLAC